MSKGWDNSMLKKLKALTGKGLSTSEIGKRLGMSKNAIVGKLNRLGWNAKAGGAAADSKTKKVEPAKEVKKAANKKAVTPKKATVTKGEAKKAVAKKEVAKKPAAKTAVKKETQQKTTGHGWASGAL